MAADARLRLGSPGLAWGLSCCRSSGPSPGEQPDPPSAPALIIHANELRVGVDGLTTGDIRRSVQNATDKGKLFELLLLAGAAASPAGAATAADSPGLSVYVGDSTSDLLPMLAVGACVGAHTGRCAGCA